MENKKGLLIVISGPAGRRKGTVTKKMLKESDDFGYSVSATTRDPRPDERDGYDYYFISREEFERKIENGEMMEYTTFCTGHLYGTLTSEALRVIESGKDLLLEIEVLGGLNVKRLYPDAILIMLLPPSYAVQEARLRGRGTDDEESILSRLERAKMEVGMLDRYDYVIYNEDGKVDECIEQIREIVRVERRAAKRNPDIPTTYFEN